MRVWYCNLCSYPLLLGAFILERWCVCNAGSWICLFDGREFCPRQSIADILGCQQVDVQIYSFWCVPIEMIQKVPICSRVWVKKSNDSDASEYQAKILWKESYKCACLQTSASSCCASCWYLDKPEMWREQADHSQCCCLRATCDYISVQVYIGLWQGAYSHASQHRLDAKI